MDKQLIQIDSFLAIINKELSKYEKNDIITFRMRIFDPQMPQNSTMLNRESYLSNIRKLVNREFSTLKYNRSAYCSLKIIPKKIAARGIFYV